MTNNDIVYFIENNRVQVKENNEVTESNSFDKDLQKPEITSSQGFEGLQLFKSWVRKQASPENYNKILICFDEVRNILESQKS